MQKIFTCILVVLFVLISMPNVDCYGAGKTALYKITSAPRLSSAEVIGDIPLPAGFERLPVVAHSFAGWLRQIALRKDNTVYLYNGQPKANQQLHYAVLDISTGTKDLQQCADAVMRLKAEYAYSNKNYAAISFADGNKSSLSFTKYAASQNGCFSHECLLHFLEIVFARCGTYTVEGMTKPIELSDMQAGDVLIKAGSPGHTMMVADMAVNKKTGQKIYLLLQGYMPAQDMHIVINQAKEHLSPWYALTSDETIRTPGWVFNKRQLRR